MSKTWLGFIKNRNRHRGQIARQTLLQYVFALIVFAIAFVLFCVLAWDVLSGIEFAPIRAFRDWVRDYLLFFGGLLFLTGWGMVTYYFFAKPLRYLDEIVLAAEKLSKSTEEPVLLPPAMKHVQDELNLVREQARYHAMQVKEAEQRKNDLLVYLAHDLKTPLTSVIGYLTLLRDEPQISDKLRERYVGIALEKAGRLEELLYEFFDMTRFSLAAISLEMERVNLSRMLEQLVSEFEPILAQSRLGWRTDIEKNVEAVCDPDKLERVFDNLIRNAAGYAYPDTEVFLSLERMGDNVQICVQNAGKTIPPEKLSRLFDQFFRVDGSRATATGGAGLGLAIAKEIVELHGGSIHAESADESVRFVVLLPCAVAQQ